MTEQSPEVQPVDLPTGLWADDDSAPAVAWLDTPGLESWLRANGLGPDVAVIDGPDPGKDPGAQVVVSWLPGAGFSVEDVLSTPAFQLRVIGPQRGDVALVRELAYRIDSKLVGRRSKWPGYIGGRYVVTMARSGGEPSHDRRDDARRAHYVCTYLATVESY